MPATTSSDRRPREGDHEVAQPPPGPPDRPGENRVGAARRLLGVQPEHRGHPVGGGDQPAEQHQRGQVGVDDLGLAADPGELLGEPAAAADELADALRRGAADREQDRVPGRPARERRPLQPPRERERAAQRGSMRPDGRAGPGAGRPRGRAAGRARTPARRPPANSATAAPSTHQRSPANGRRVSVQPSGSTQVSQDGPLAPVASPTARARNATPSTPIARPRAARAPAVSCAVTALTPVNARPQVPMASASAADPAAGQAEQRAAPGTAARSGSRWPGPRPRAPTPAAPAGRPGPSRQLEPPGLLVAPGVPDDEEDRHQRREQRAPHAVPPDGQRADRVAVQPPVEEESAGLLHPDETSDSRATTRLVELGERVGVRRRRRSPPRRPRRAA